uniref:Uncharacterized protein n=1 Tax=Phytophthora ramorum TaxID=164328 RepID=H3GWX0_PHYRM
MSLQDLAPVNSQRALQTAINAFGRFLAAEGVSTGFIAASLIGDASGAVFVKLMDRFGVHLAFVEGRVGKPLAKNSVMSYFRHVKNWLLDTYPTHRATIEKKLLKMGQTLERHCLKRAEGRMVKKAPACTKEDLRILMDGIYYDAASSKDYQDAALLTAEEQGISLFPDKDNFITWPLHAIAMALVMQNAPCPQLFDHPHLDASSYENMTNPVEIPLAEALVACENFDEPSEPPKKKQKQPEDNVKIHAYVNRVVKTASAVQAKAKPTANLTSHSFRRGGAQHANSDPLLSAQWIFDRGSWNMTATNKAFAYVFNTTCEDEKVARVLSGWDSSKKPPVPMLSWFDSASRQQALEMGNLLCQTSVATQDPEKKLNARVVEVLTASAIQHFPEVLERYPMCPSEVTKSRMATINAIVSYKEFKHLCITFAKASKLRIMDVSIRMLRSSLMQTVGSKERIPEALRVIFMSLRDKCKDKIDIKKRGLVEIDDINEWLTGPSDGAHAQINGVYACSHWKEGVLLVDWGPTLEPRENISKELIAVFNRERRALNEAEEDNSFNHSADA